MQNWVADNRTSASLLPKPRVATKADLARPNTHEPETLRQPGGPATQCYLCCEEWRGRRRRGFGFRKLEYLLLYSWHPSKKNKQTSTLNVLVHVSSIVLIFFKDIFLKPRLERKERKENYSIGRKTMEKKEFTC